MSKNYVGLGHEFEKGARALGQQTPDIMGVFRNLAAVLPWSMASERLKHTNSSLWAMPLRKISVNE